MWYPLLFLLRRAIFALTLVAMTNSPIGQVFIYGLCSLVMLIHLIKDRPFDDSLYNCVQIGNELLILTSSFLLFEFTDFVPNPNTRINAGFAYIVLLMICAVLNCLSIFSAIWRRFTLLKLRFLNKNNKQVTKLTRRMTIRRAPKRKKSNLFGNTERPIDTERGLLAIQKSKMVN